MPFKYLIARPITPQEGFFRRSMKASVGIALLTGLFVTVYVGPGFAGHYLVFAFWMVANLGLWRASAGEILGRRRVAPMIILIGVKILWLALAVGLCAAMGIRERRDLAAFLLGINTPFLVILLKASGAAMTRKSSSERAPGPRERV